MTDRRSLAARVAWWLRTIADRIDYAGAPKATHLTFTFEERTGIVVRDDGRGCRLWHIEDYEKGTRRGRACRQRERGRVAAAPGLIPGPCSRECARTSGLRGTARRRRCSVFASALGGRHGEH